MKRIVICCDGTWNRADQEEDGEPCPTNVVKFATRVRKRSEGVVQAIYYDHGVGTGNALDRFSGGAFGRGLEDNIHDAYRFLIANYEPGDALFLLGFSRGAFTARSLAGMIRNCGILERASVGRYREALALYRDHARGPDHEESLAFKRAHSVLPAGDVPVRFLGVWDTVGSLGIPLRGLRALTRRRHQFHDTELSGIVEHAYHALAIDERRAPFAPSLWRYEPKPNQTVQQVWFCGVHSDVGGGYPEAGLSDLALDWMLEKAQSAGLALDDAAMAALRTHGHFGGALHQSRRSFYRLTPGRERAIGGDPTQSLHWSVYKRWDSDDTYRPPGLRRYFQQAGDPRGGS
ncbi:MAG TPA: DUF2235 domain-containing protein [Longimicrobiales bacterium]|nr:DUF2235 domain-containing protein [Longimicrobiales bacterium]